MRSESQARMGIGEPQGLKPILGQDLLCHQFRKQIRVLQGSETL